MTVERVKITVVLGDPDVEEPVYVDVTPTDYDPRPVCCGILTCQLCGRHDPLSGVQPICACGRW
jgi:hypothetical protein